MYLTEKEIFGQYEALEKTYRYFRENAGRIRKFAAKVKPQSLTWLGCGSSYCLCKSAQVSAGMRLDLPAHAVAAGDLLLNLPSYRKPLKKSLLIAPSRSGETSEVVKAVRQAQKEFKNPCLSICAREKSSLSKLSDLCLEMPWIFDESVCQTRSITNLYAANLLLIATLAKDARLLDEVGAAIKSGPAFVEKYRGVLKELGGERSWNQVVVLADSELCGIAEAGALSFKEICAAPSNYYHLLDVRHGPIVVIDDWTLVIMACNRNGIDFQKDLLKDLKKKSPLLLTVSHKHGNFWGSDYSLQIPSFKNFGVAGIPFAFIAQAVSLYRAIARGINPDLPSGLAPWIKL